MKTCECPRAEGTIDMYQHVWLIYANGAIGCQRCGGLPSADERLAIQRGIDLVIPRAGVVARSGDGVNHPTCSTCPYYKRTAPTGHGVCRRHAPVPVYHKSMDGMAFHDYTETVWPPVLDNEWCGDHPEAEAARQHRVGKAADGGYIPDYRGFS